MKVEKIILLFLLTISLISLYYLSLKESNPSHKKEKTFVTNIIDGDTIVIQGGDRVRLLGIDSPEKGEQYYKEAKDRVEQLIEQKEVFLLREKRDRDDYNRLLRYVFLNETNINLLLVQEGLARCYFYEESKYKKICLELESWAIKNKIGIWNNSSI